MVKLPTVVVFELTYQCNHKCMFCSCPWENEKQYKKNELSKYEWFKVVDTLANYGIKQVTLSGGEPLLRTDLEEIIRYIYSKGASVNLISNGKLISDEILSLLKELNISLSISVPGLETFEEHTGIDNIESVLNIFEKAKKLDIKTTANIAVTKKNLPELYKNIALPLILGADYILLNRFLPGGRGMFNKEFLLTNDEINEMLDIAEEVLSQANRYGQIGTELPYCIIKNPKKYKHLTISSKCSAAKYFFVVDPSGYVKVCNHSPHRLVHYSMIEELLKNNYWNNYINSNYIPEMCKSCIHLDVCDGGCREAANVNYGNINDIDPSFEFMN
jgi:radical SAM protein with 4Fe4S-binding SPASM domain